ncbi:hypothetical protein BGX27_003425, partial [Mortierella sp. AM989]
MGRTLKSQPHFESDGSDDYDTDSDNYDTDSDNHDTDSAENGGSEDKPTETGYEFPERNAREGADTSAPLAYTEDGAETDSDTKTNEELPKGLRSLT